MTWEYKVVVYRMTDDLEMILNSYGRQNWEAWYVRPASGGYGGSIAFKRLKPPPAPKTNLYKLFQVAKKAIGPKDV